MHINSKRKDGYHSLQTLFQLLDFYDELSFSITDNPTITRIRGNETVPHDQDLIVKAAKLLQQKTNTKHGANISIVKRIPAGSGLGGGSSNCATVLIALNILWNTRLTQTQLIQLGLKLGADVPVFIKGQSAWAQGIGDILTPATLPQHYFLVVFINKHISTAKIFSHYALTMRPAIGKISDFSKIENTHNDCLQAAILLEGEIAQALALLDTCVDAIGKARMSGTGSCVFAEFLTEKKALVAQQKIPNRWTSFVAQAINTSPNLHWAVAKR